jgi:hypothetical protein
MKIEQINRRFAELSEICWHVYQEQGMLYRCSCGATRECESSIIEHCDKNNPDFCAHPELVLEVMMPMEGFGDYLAYLCATNYNQCLGALVPVEYMRDKTGKFALLAIKWMEETL